MGNFAKDLAEGKMAEQRVAKALMAAGCYESVTFSEGNFSDYDAEAVTKSGKVERLEMKNDKKSAVTGNFFAEIWCHKKASGLETTKADYYVVTTHNPMQHWRIPVKTLKNIVKTCKIASGGDDAAARGYLVPVSKFPKECLVNA